MLILAELRVAEFQPTFPRFRTFRIIKEIKELMADVKKLVPSIMYAQIQSILFVIGFCLLMT